LCCGRVESFFGVFDVVGCLRRVAKSA
jgi:hypothetical protein